MISHCLSYSINNFNHSVRSTGTLLNYGDAGAILDSAKNILRYLSSPGNGKCKIHMRLPDIRFHLTDWLRRHNYPLSGGSLWVVPLGRDIDSPRGGADYLYVPCADLLLVLTDTAVDEKGKVCDDAVAPLQELLKGENGAAYFNGFLKQMENFIRREGIEEKVLEDIKIKNCLQALVRAKRN